MKPLRQNLLLLALLSGSAFAAPIVRTNTADALNLTAAWTGGVLPSAAGSVATWNASSTLVNTLGANLTWGGLDVSSASGAVTISGANGLTFAAGSTMTVSGNNLTIGNKDAGTLNLGNVTLTGSAKLTFNKTADTGTTNFNAANALAFNGTLALRGGTPSTTPAAMQGGTGRFWLNSVNGSQAAGTAFALDTGTSATDGQDFIIGDWDATSGNRRLTLSSLTGFGTIRTDAGVTGTRNLIVDQATDTVFNGMLLSHASTANPNAVRRISFEKKGTGSLTLAGFVGKQTASAGASASDVDLTVTAGTLVLTAANTRTGATTIGSSGTLKVGNGGANSLLGGSAVTNDGSLVFNYGSGATVTYAGLVSGGGSVTKQGAGLLALTASSTYSGATTIEQGTLRIGGHLDSSAATVKARATLATGLQASSGAGYVKALTLESGTSSTFRIGSTTWDTIVVNDSDAFTISGTHTITPVYQGGLNPGDRREVIDYNGAMSGSFSNFQLSSGTRFQLINDTDNSNIVLEYTGGNVIWKGNLSSNWDLDATTNWILESDSSVTKYLQGDTVVFNDSATTSALTLTGTLSPISTSFNNSTLDYTLTGSAIAGGSLIKNGAATATLLIDNTYTGATTINAGKLSFGNGGTTGNIGSGAVSVASGATLEFNRSNVTPGAVDLDYKTTAKLRNVSGAGQITLTGGAILFNYTGTGIGFSESSSWSNFSGNLVVKGGSEFRTIRNGATAMGTGSVVLGDATTSGILSQIEGSWTWTNPIDLTGASNKILNRSGVLTGGRTLKLQGVISGNGGLSFEDPAGTMTEPNRGFILTAANTLGGTLSIASGVPVRVGGIPGNTDVNQSGAGSSGSLGSASVINNGTLTFSRTDAHSVANAISGSGALRIGIPSTAGFGDTSTQVLTYTGTATYTGATTVNNGRLVIGTGASIGGSGMTVQASGTISGSGSVAAPLTVSGTIAPGTGVGTLTVSGNTALTGTLAVEVNTAADKLAVTGDLSLAGSFTVTESGAGFSAASYVIAECTGTLTSTLTPPTGYTLTQTGSQLILGKITGTAFSNWIDGYSLGGQTAINQDPDSDGVANGLEFLLKGGNPQTPGGTQLPTSTDGGANLIFTFERDDRAKAANSGIVVTVEAGTDLATWPQVFTIGNDTAGSSAGVVISNDGDANPDTVTVTIPKSSATAKFAHLKVTGTP